MLWEETVGRGRRCWWGAVREGFSEEIAVPIKEDPVIPNTKERMFQTETEGIVSAKILKPEWAKSIKRMKEKSTWLKSDEKEEKQVTT